MLIVGKADLSIVNEKGEEIKIGSVENSVTQFKSERLSNMFKRITYKGKEYT